MNLILTLGLLWLSCAYYNTFYNAEQAFKKAEKEREKRIEEYKKNKNRRRDTDPDKLSGTELQNYDKAIEKSSKVLQLYPDSKYVDDALLLLGQCFYYKKDNQKAERKFKELLENYPESEYVSQGKLWLARTYVQMENYEEAKQLFHNIAISRAPREIRDEALLYTGELYFVQKDYITAAHEYRTAVNNIKKKENRARASYQMGECYYQLKDYEKAIEAFELALKYSTDEDTENETLFRLAKCHRLRRQYDEAMDYLQRLLARDSYSEEWPMAKIEMANNIYLKEKQKQLNEWKELEPEERKVKEGDFYLAEEWYYAIIEDHPRTEGSAQAYYYLAEINKNEYANYDSAYAYYMRVRDQYSRSVMVDSATNKAEAIIQLLSLKEIVKRQEAILFGKKYVSDYDFYDEKIILDDSTRFKLRKAKMMRRLQKWLASNFEITALPDTLIADSLFADSLGLIDSLWVRDENGNLVQGQNYYDQFNEEEFEPQETEEERRLRQKQETLVKKLTPKIRELEKNELIKNKTLLAEEYLFNFSQYDSALTQYTGILASFPDSVTQKMKPQILYTMSYIQREIKNQPETADSLLTILAHQFPRTPQGKEARHRLNLAPPVEDQTDQALELFKSAEQQYLEEKNIENAISLYRKVEEKYPESKLAAKSLFAAAWLYDRVLNENEQAKELYSELAENYKDNEFGKQSQAKLDALKKEQERLLAAAKADSLKKAMPDSMLASADSTQFESIAGETDSTRQSSLGPTLANADSTTQISTPIALKSDELQYDSEGVLRTEPRRPSRLLFNYEDEN